MGLFVHQTSSPEVIQHIQAIRFLSLLLKRCVCLSLHCSISHLICLCCLLTARPVWRFTCSPNRAERYMRLTYEQHLAIVPGGCVVEPTIEFRELLNKNNILNWDVLQQSTLEKFICVIRSSPPLGNCLCWDQIFCSKPEAAIFFTDVLLMNSSSLPMSLFIRAVHFTFMLTCFIWPLFCQHCLSPTCCETPR